MPMARKMTDHFRKFHEKDFIPWITQMSEHKVMPRNGKESDCQNQDQHDDSNGAQNDILS